MVRRDRAHAAAQTAHRWVGLVIASFLVLTGVTGSVLAFQSEIEAALSPELFRVEDRPPRDPIALASGLEERLPEGVRVRSVPLVVEPGRAVRFGVTGAGDDEYFVDPHDGAVRGSRRWGDLSQGKKNLVPFLYRVHTQLALDAAGAYALGIVALLWTVHTFVGVFLTFPKRRRPWRFVPRWAHAWRLKVSNLSTTVYTWHRASGLWLSGLAFVFAWSAVGFNLPEVYRPTMRVLLGTDEPASRPEASSPIPPRISWSDAARSGASEAERRGWSLRRPHAIDYDAARGEYRYVVESEADVSRRYPATSVWIDGQSGAIVAVHKPTGGALGDTVTTWLAHLHFGSVTGGGWPYRGVVLAFGLATASLSVTGVWMWLRRRARADAAARRA